ncbi:MAG TPA: hypothetical protein VKX41_08625 [Alloacidobacterium sp.]|nr:hypothetical protein [Alloacidobacterium sp.]
MIGRGLIATAVLIFAGALSIRADSDPPQHLTGRLQDVYAIYSALMPGAVFTNLGPSQNQRWAIADTTINIDDMNPALAPDAALKAPSGATKQFQEAVNDFNLRKHQREPIIRQFRLDRPYILLNSSEAAEFRAVRANASPSNGLAAKYSGYPGINYFSDVYFDSHRSVALVYMLNWCANLCGQGEWVYLEKQNGHWVKRSGQEAITSGAKPF